MLPFVSALECQGFENNGLQNRTIPGSIYVVITHVFLISLAVGELMADEAAGAALSH